jgi:hypothetical protein
VKTEYWFVDEKTEEGEEEDDNEDTPEVERISECPDNPSLFWPSVPEGDKG